MPDPEKNQLRSFADVVARRFSCRSYQECAVDDKIIEKCLDAARQAPSACNKQPWRFVVVKDAALRLRICNEAMTYPVPMPWAKSAPVIIALCLKENFITHKLAASAAGIKYQLIDAGIAGEHLALAAEAQGLGTCWIGWFKKKKVKKILGIPRRVDVVSLFTLGYPAERAEPAEKLALCDIYSVDRYKK